MQILIVVLLLFLASARQAKAYADPGSGALIVQLLAASFVGGLFFFRKFVRKFVSFFKHGEKPAEPKDE